MIRTEGGGQTDVDNVHKKRECSPPAEGGVIKGGSCQGTRPCWFLKSRAPPEGSFGRPKKSWEAPLDRGRRDPSSPGKGTVAGRRAKKNHIDRGKNKQEDGSN